MPGRLVLLALVAGLLTVAWLELESPRASLVEVGRILGLGLAPALVLLGTRRRLAGLALAPLALLAAGSLAFRIPLTDMRPRSERDFFGPLFAAIGDGLDDFYATRVPFDPGAHTEMGALLLLAVFLFLVVSGLLVAAGRPLWAGCVLLAGAGWAATLAATIPGAAPLRTGGVVLAALLCLLFLARPERVPRRGLGRAAGLGVVLVAVAVAASTSPAVAKDGILLWQRWNLPKPGLATVGVRYVWSSNYGGITFPKKETPVLSIKAPKRRLYWRATTLDTYTGAAWVEDLSFGPVRGRELVMGPGDSDVPAAALGEKSLIRQDVTVLALADTHLVAAAFPLRWQFPGGAPRQVAIGGVVVQSDGLTRGETYTAWSYTPQVAASELAQLPAGYPPALARFLEVAPGVQLPFFDLPDRDRVVRALFRSRSSDALLAEYQPLYRQARELVGEATSPYVAAATLEAWFRSEGGFRYEEHPRQPFDSTPPLVDFVLRTKEGYCQHFAGAMAVMLRLLGVPARVAAGFTSGEYDQRRGAWTVTDHNAHTWVEVWFPEYGWLPFDPTPGRGQLGAPYSSSSPDFGRGGLPSLGVAPDALSAILRDRLRGLGPGPDGAGGGAGAADRTAPGAHGGGQSIAGVVLLVLAVLAGVVLLVKAARRRARFVTRDPRRLASACRRDLVAYLTDQRLVFSPSATLEELGVFLERAYRLDTTPFVRAAAAARFGSPDAAGEAARRARRELTELRRQLRGRLSLGRRARGALSLRSLGV